MPHNSGQSNRDLLSAHGAAGKGDADRSPGWRDGYGDVADLGSRPSEAEGFRQTGAGRWRKVYGNAALDKLVAVDVVSSFEQPGCGWEGID
jgi:hypothetical protein